MGQQTSRMLEQLRAERVESWFELGLLIDRLREDRPVPAATAPSDFRDFRRELQRGIGLVTFDFGVDGVSVEIAKYAGALQALAPDARIHYIAGHFSQHAGRIIDGDAQWHVVEAMDGFRDDTMYRGFFARKLERGGAAYNHLIRLFWHEALKLTEHLGDIVEDNDIRLLFVVNVNSNPGNPALALACVLVSEQLGIPVINNCHDFYWEGGRSAVEREVLGLAAGPRDHFFTNAHVGEIFSLIEALYPWESRSWLTVCINQSQLDRLCEQHGISPANLAAVGTAIDIERYTRLDRRRIVEAWTQLEALLRGERSQVEAQAVGAVLEKGLKGRRPTLIAAKKQSRVDFASNNVVLLQPTRIIARKKIEVGLRLIERLFEDSKYLASFQDDPSRKLTLTISGPVATGHDGYLDRLVKRFETLVTKLDPSIRDRVYLCLLFSAFDAPEFCERYEQPLGMPELYNLASMVMLPSETEGRGLPIIESSACGTAILTRRYEPLNVFQAVVGENLSREQRLDVNAFRGPGLDTTTVARVRERLLAPGDFADIRQHNRRVVEHRFSMPMLTRDVEEILRRLHHQLQPAEKSLAHARTALREFEQWAEGAPAVLPPVVSTEHREYLPGFGRMGFMLMLKSLIDPSYFRIEEQRLRGMAFDFARRMTRGRGGSPAEEADFYNAVDSLFLYRKGELPVRVDHSLAYRHRNRRRYPYRDLTPQELTGVIASLHHRLFGPVPSSQVGRDPSHQLADWHSMVAQCCGGPPAIDDRPRLRRRLEQNVPMALFLGDSVEHELEVFVLQTARLRMGLGMRDELAKRPLPEVDAIAPISIIQRERALPSGISAEVLEKGLANGMDAELELLYRRGVCRVVASDQRSVGIDFRQLGPEALAVLGRIREAGGFMVAIEEQAVVTTDGAGIERFHIGRASDPITANILGVPQGSGFVQWAPAGLRTTLAYPTPIQTASSLSHILAGRRFRSLCDRLGEAKVLAALQKDAEQRGSPVKAVLEGLDRPIRARRGRVLHESLNGVYDDGSPWSGVIATVLASKRPLRYAIVSTSGPNRTVPEFVRRFNRSPGRRASLAWNGGYILNAELVGKLGLPESYIGSPLGLIVADGRVKSPPLFNKPAFVVGRDHSLAVRRVSCASGLRIRAARSAIDFGPQHRNLDAPGKAACFYDLLYESDTLPGNGRTLVRLVGNRIMEIRHTQGGESLPALPVGLVCSFAAGTMPGDWVQGRALSLDIGSLSGIANAVEAGPLLLHDGELAIDMQCEGWKTRSSILTQAARLDFLDMRGPKIALGLDGKGNLAVLAVNGRIRESVGATHIDMAEILRARGMQTAMGFDPGGSATLVVGEETLNISPYNSDYERNVYSLPPQPRAVANAVVGY